MCSAAQECDLSRRAIRSDSATVWSPPLNVGNCINQHISPKAESIYSTTRLLSIIRPPAMIVFAPHVLSPASQGKGRGKIKCYDVHVRAQDLRGLGRSTNGGSGLEPLLLLTAPALSCTMRRLPPCRQLLHFLCPNPPLLLLLLQMASFWPFEVGVHTLGTAHP